MMVFIIFHTLTSLVVISILILDSRSEEQAIPVNDGIRALCDILGYDPLYIVNEGKVVFVVSAHDADKVCEILKEDSLGRDAAIIGKVLRESKGKVCLKTVIGGTRIVDMLVGDQLPRIC
jgi:hydrogenase expression/formation protein HypE